MRRLLSFFGVICVLFAFLAAAPQAVQAEGDPPPTPQPLLPPWITGQNPQVSLSNTAASYVDTSGVVEAQVIGLPLPSDPPAFIELATQEYVDQSPALVELAVPQRFQDPDDPTCGAAALGMALEFLSLSQGGEAPSTEALVSDLENSGFLYNTGTGVEELAYLARSYGYRGASPFAGWTLETLAGELAAGRPTVVSLGLNGEGQPGHFVVLAGMAADGSWVRYNDPVLGEQIVSAEEFLASWALQGYSGLTVQKGALAASSDPLLPWMGLLGAVSVLTVLAKTYPLGAELKSLVGDIQSILSSPSRKGLGGALEASTGGGGGGGSSPPYPAPAGFHWVKTTVPQYGWQETQVTKTRQVPILVAQQVRVGTRVWYEQVPRYRTVWVDKGSWAWRKVTKYKREKYIRYYRTISEKKTRWVRKNGRFVQETYYVTNRVPVYGYHDVPYTTWEKYWKPKWVSEKVFDGYTQVRHEEPIYETRMMPSGQYRTEYYTEIVKTYQQVGTTVKWELVKDPIQTPTPYNPTPTPIPTPPNTSTPTTQPPGIFTEYPTATPSTVITAENTITPTLTYGWPYTNLVTPILPDESETYADSDYIQLEEDIDTINKLKKILSPLFSTGQKIIAGGNINITQADDMLYIYGPRASRSTLGFKPYTNWIKSENVVNILNSTDEFKLSKSSAASTTLGLALNVAANSVDLAQGDIDRYEYAAALTVDTGITAGSALLAGVVSGAASGALVGGVAGLGIGAVPGAIIGGVLGALAAISTTWILDRTGARDAMVDSVADMYREWIE
jgi:hypothetical protein